MRASGVQQRYISANPATSMDTLWAYVIKRNKFLSGLGNQMPICYKWEQYMLLTSPYVVTKKICNLVMSCFPSKSGHSTKKLIVRRFPHHLTWLQTLHIGWNNIIQETSTLGQDWTLAQMAKSCQLVYISLCSMIQIWRSLEIGTYTTDTVKIVGSSLSIWSTWTLRNNKK